MSGTALVYLSGFLGCLILVVRQNHAAYSISAISQKNEQDGNASFLLTGPAGMSRKSFERLSAVVTLRLLLIQQVHAYC